VSNLPPADAPQKNHGLLLDKPKAEIKFELLVDDLMGASQPVSESDIVMSIRPTPCASSIGTVKN